MDELLKLHKKMYDVRWNGAEGEPEQLEKEFTALADREGVDLEKVNEMLNQIYIPPYKDEALPEHLKSTHGGKREGAGRPSVGTTRRVALTLPDELWEMVDKRKETWGSTQSATLRMMIEGYWNREGAIDINADDAVDMYDELEAHFIEQFGDETDNEIYTRGIRALYKEVFGGDKE